jgi:hypothetical protein
MSTPSSRLERRKEKDWEFGPWYDHYVRPFGKCHPDFDTILLNGDPRGVKVCVRREEEDYGTINKYPNFGLYRYSRNLYDPLNYKNKNFDTVPNEYDLITKDYLKLNHDFNGTGLYQERVCTKISESFYS